MAAALHPLRNDAGPNHVIYPRTLITDLDFRDNRYPGLSQHSKSSQRTSTMIFGASDRSGWEGTPNMNDEFGPRKSSELSAANKINSSWALEQRNHVEYQYLQKPQSRGGGTSIEIQSLGSQSQQSQSQEPQRSSLSYALPPGAARRVVERYSLDDDTPSRVSTEAKPPAAEHQDKIRNRMPQTPRKTAIQERSMSIPPATPGHPSLPSAGMEAGPSNITKFPPIMPLSASPSYNPPIAPNHRAYAQQPTYITPPSTPTPVNTVYSPRPPLQPPEEVCIECAMRDQDMADVDVTSPGVWERESDAVFEDLKRRELEDDTKGLVTIDDPKRPRVKGGRLTEQNLKLWLSVNPREPTSRQQTLSAYIKSQRTLLEAEALAHACAMQEAKQLDSRMRDTYSQLRRSAYDMGANVNPADDTGGVRIKAPLSPSSPINPTHSREITLLENGMIVEHVDVRKEEREARERRRKEERRARKSSRGSMMDVTSIISAQSLGHPTTDGGNNLKPHSRYSQTSVLRPMSALTAPHERPELPRAYSQASFSDVHSLGSASPIRTRFFGIKNFGGGWRSQVSLAPSGMSGSMVDMHVALQRETHPQQLLPTPIDSNTPRRSRIWPSNDLEVTTSTHDAQSEIKTKKKKTGLAKIWRIVTGSGKNENPVGEETSQSLERTEDDLPLAPPPPLSYLVNRGPSDLRAASGRHTSSPSLSTTALPKLGLASDMVEIRSVAGNYDDLGHQGDSIGKNQAFGTKNIHPVTSEPDMRQRTSQTLSIPLTILNSGSPSSRPSSREKSLPPLPGEPGGRIHTNTTDTRPRTLYSYDNRQFPLSSDPTDDFLPPNAPFRTPDTRRQSFGGTSSRPNLAVQTLPSNSKPLSPESRIGFGPRYDEFGLSRRSLGRLEHVQEYSRVQKTLPTNTKRKSRFGLSSLLGKKKTLQEQEYINENTAHQFPSMRQSGSDGLDDLTNNGYATSTSRHSALSASGPNTRISITSRKALEERVAQDPDFVAYRYPSNDQHLDFLR